MPRTDGRARPARRTRALALVAALCAAGPGPALAQGSSAFEAQLLEVAGETVKLNRGRDHGVQVGQVFDLYSEARVYHLPLTRGQEVLVKANDRVAQVVVYDCEPSTARARIVSRSDSSPLQTERLRAILNPTAVPPNRKPTFLDPPQFEPTPWRARRAIKLQVSNEPDEAVTYTWRVTGGLLEHARTLEPENVWTAPPRPGTFRLTVEALDAAGNVARVALDLQGAGMRGSTPPASLVPRQVISGASRYAPLRDVAFDRFTGWARARSLEGRRYVLEAPGGMFSGQQHAVVVELGRASTRLPVPERDLRALAASHRPGALFAIDGDSRAVLRFGFGREWAQVLKQEPQLVGEAGGGLGNGRFKDPVDLALSPSGERLYVLDAEQRCVQAFTNEGEFVVSFGQPGDGERRLLRPRALAVGPDDTVWVLDDGRKAVVAYREWRPVREIVVGTPEQELVGLAVDPFTGHVYVLDRTAGAIKRYSPQGQLLSTFSGEPGTASQLVSPTRLRIDPTRVLWVLDREGAAVARFDPEGAFVGRSGGVELPGPLKLAATPEGGAVALDPGAAQVTCFDRQGWVVARFGGRGAVAAGGFEDPVDVAVTGSGDLFVLDAEKRQLLKFSPQGAFLGALGRPGEGREELEGVMDLTSVDDRSYLSVLQQRAEDNFNLVQPGTGRTAFAWGSYLAELSPRYGCVTGVTGPLGRDAAAGRESQEPTLWTVEADDRERLFWARRGGDAPRELTQVFDEVTDLEAVVGGRVLVCDYGAYKVYLLGPDGVPVITVDGEKEPLLGAPLDVAADDYGQVFVYDASSRRVIVLGE